MNKKGFTLVELLAVVAILAILVIIALPNVMGMFNKSKENTFITELKSIYRTAESQWISESMFDTQEKVYSRCKSGCTNPLNLSGREELEYYIKLDKSGKVVEFYATDGTYQFEHNGDLLLTNIQGVEKIADLPETEIISISNIFSNGGGSKTTSVVVYPGGKDKSSVSVGDLVKIGDDYCAQLMFVMGTNGGGLTHPNWDSNLKFAVKIQQEANEKYPGLFKPMILRNSRYNQNLGKAACIIEVGATGNTLDQALNSMKYLAEIFNEVRCEM